MFLIVSGLPGAGKTLHTISTYKNINDELVRQGKAPRPIYYHGIPLSEKGDQTLGWTELNTDQIKNWHEELPPGAILIVDEAQKHWPIRSASKPIPPELREIETHRHKGIDLVFITQDPTLLDTHARKLANEHIHYVRPHGAKYSKRYHSGSGVVSVTNKSELNALVVSRIGHPKKIYDLYKSAEVHTHKFRPPKILYLFVFGLLLLAFLAYKAANIFSEDGSGSTAPNQAQPQHENTSERESMGWAKLLKPEIQGLPFTAPLYREQAMKVVEVPRVAGCMSLKGVCNCYTQQGTKINDISDQICQKWIVNRPFDHLVYQGKEGNSRGDANRKQPEQLTQPVKSSNHKQLYWPENRTMPNHI
ncbi:zonular occludens toxin domain-containing protein [Gilvimarinus sp. 1_MG-2023]|uniref:zonular occludens toxin domain-containing protein n=1 Tax=Gilvimarinus sp. 1_MG-2023 TaxID=3062638 RepID=UPI0026E261A0|nr:zonular occludens toxin domain-containing protein [Gilvimarinus sp. 1_MG-2023]MDO6748526.1 zonular occludens toxin domain-containing protein [Gilvimarinus sp. 1_MG-2023]